MVSSHGIVSYCIYETCILDAYHVCRWSWRDAAQASRQPVLLDQTPTVYYERQIAAAMRTLLQHFDASSAAAYTRSCRLAECAHRHPATDACIPARRLQSHRRPAGKESL